MEVKMCKASDIANFFINISLSDKKDYITELFSKLEMAE